MKFIKIQTKNLTKKSKDPNDFIKFEISGEENELKSAFEILAFNRNKLDFCETIRIITYINLNSLDGIYLSFRNEEFDDRKDLKLKKSFEKFVYNDNIYFEPEKIEIFRNKLSVKDEVFISIFEFYELCSVIYDFVDNLKLILN